MAVLKCATCGKTQDIPTHCGEEMKPIRSEGKYFLLCWMGEVCNKQSMPRHCGKPMQVAQK